MGREFDVDSGSQHIKVTKGGGEVVTVSKLLNAEFEPPTANTDYSYSSIVENGNTLYPFFTDHHKLKVSSSSTDDTSAGTGIRSIFITGVDRTFVEKSEVVVLNGQTPVTTVNDYFRINSAIPASAGSTLEAQGNIWLYNEDESSVIAGVPQTFIHKQGRMDIKTGRMEQAIHTVPTGKRTFFIDTLSNIADTIKATARLIAVIHPVSGEDFTAPLPLSYTLPSAVSTDGSSIFQFEAMVGSAGLPPGSTIEFRVQTSKTMLTHFFQAQIMDVST